MRCLGRLACCAFLLMSFVLNAGPASAQGGGTIVGTVADETQAVLPGVTVTVTSNSLMGSRTEVTGPDGRYRLPALPPGEYAIVFELAGFGTVKREGVRIDVGFTATINSTLKPATVQETVTVSGASPVVDVTASRVSTHLDAGELMKTLVGSR